MRASLPLALLTLVGSCAGTGSAARAPAVDVRTFVERTYIHGVPYEEAALYGPNDVSVLMRMLQDPAQEDHWANVVVTMCAIGDEQCVDVVLDFIRGEGQATVSSPVYRAKSGAVMALGYVVNRNGNERCFSFLEQACHPVYWAAGIRWSERGGAVGAQRDRELATMAILGLGLAGTPGTRAILEGLVERPDPQLGDSEDLVRTALETNRQIGRIGLVEYYRRGRH